MAVAQKRRRRTTKAPTPSGKDSWQILGPKGEILRDVPYGEGATLAMAQGLIHRIDPEADTLELTVRLKALFGEPDNLFRVVREEDGSVTTYRV